MYPLLIQNLFPGFVYKQNLPKFRLVYTSKGTSEEIKASPAIYINCN